MEKKDELSVIMMVDRLQNADDYTRLIQEAGKCCREDGRFLGKGLTFSLLCRYVL